MARNTIASLPHQTGDERCWLIEGRVFFGSRGTYLDPPDPDEVEFLDVVEDMGRRLGPPQRLGFDDFVESNDLDEAKVSELEDAFINHVNGDAYDGD